MLRKLLALVLIASSTAVYAQARLIDWVNNGNVSDPNTIVLGYPVPIPVDTALPFDGFRTYNGLHTRHQDLMITTDVVHGQILGNTRNGQPIWVYRLGDEDTETVNGLPEPAMLTNGGIHAREWQSPEVITGIMELLASKEEDNHLYRYLLDNANIVIIPVLNIDGFLQTQRFPDKSWLGTDPVNPETWPRDGRMRRKNMLGVDENINTQNDHLLGVDLNRNNPPFWATSQFSSPSNLSLVYHGTAPQSEPETQTLAAAVNLAPADRLTMYTDVHSALRSHLWAPTGSQRLSNLTIRLLSTFSNHHLQFPARKFYDARPPTPETGSGGIGSTDGFFATTYQIPAWTLEVEPNQGGAEYGGTGENGHDGFILPESEIKRVREQLAESFAVAYYQQAGPPTVMAVRIVDQTTQAVVFESEWDTASNTQRQLYSKTLQSLQLDRDYTLWVAYDKPMRWRTDGQVTALPGQPNSTLNVSNQFFAGDDELLVEVTNARWADMPGDAPDGYLRYRDDAWTSTIRVPSNPTNLTILSQPKTITLHHSAFNMTGQQVDSKSSTVIDWKSGGWGGYENEAGQLTDQGGVNASTKFQATKSLLGNPFLIEPGMSAAWFDESHDGEGFVLEILANNRTLLYWFTYDEEGNQRWFIAVGEVRGNRILFPELLVSEGGKFGPDFNPDDVVFTNVGSATFIWSSCDSASMDWQIGNEHSRQNVRRLSRLLGLPCGQSVDRSDANALLNGSWYDITHDGEGFVVEYLQDGRVLVYWFSYDPYGNQRWFFGVGTIVESQITFPPMIEIPEMLTATGGIFGPDFDPDTVEFTTWGSVTMTLDCDGGTAQYQSTEEGFGSGSFNLQQLTKLDGLACP